MFSRTLDARLPESALQNELPNAIKADPSGRAVEGLSLQPLAYGGWGFESRREYVCLLCLLCLVR